MNAQALTRLRTWMETQGLERCCLYRPENFAWLTGGGDNTVIVGEGVAYLEVGHRVELHTSMIEADRLVMEEVGEVTLVTHPWYAPPPVQRPNDLEHDLTTLRMTLCEEEVARFRRLGKDTSCAVTEVMRSARPGWSEHDLAGALAAALRGEGIQPVVLLTAGEDRVFRYRHPLPRGFPLGTLAMGVVCGRREGLVANLTRLCSFGHPQARALYSTVLRVEQAALDATRPGTTLVEILQVIEEAYRNVGHREAVEAHHQGGIAGYRPRECLALPGVRTCIAEGMCVAWNPSLPGAKVEDTFLVGPSELENLTHDDQWPEADVGGRARPDLLEV